MATTVNLGKLRFDWRGDYLAASSYVANDVVTWRMQQYICTANTTAGTAPSNTSFWTVFSAMFNTRGTWASGQSYLVGDIVVFSVPGNLASLPASIAGNYSLSRSTPTAYFCGVAHTSSGTITPADTGYWTPVNRKAISGAQTASGSTTQNYNLGVYSNSNYSCLVLPNRGIAFDNSAQYYGGTTGRNSTDSYTAGMIATNGQVMSWGFNQNGSTGVGGNSVAGMVALSFPHYDFWRSTSNTGSGVHATPDNGIPRAIQWEKNYDHNLVLMNSGEVFAWGHGGQGQNGDGSTSNRTFPVRVGGTLASVYNNTNATTNANNAINGGHAFNGVRIKRISRSGGGGFTTSGGHCMALDENGQLWTWGQNGVGQLGHGAINSNLNTTDASFPNAIPKTAFNVGAITTGQNVVAMWACGHANQAWSMAVTADGNLWVWGYNGSGQLGLGNTTSYFTPQVVNNVANQGLSFGGATLGTITKVQWTASLRTTALESVAILTSRGLVYCAGNNNAGWMGLTPSATVNVWTNIGGGPGTVANAVCRDMWLYGSGGNLCSMMQRDSVTGNCWTAGYNNYGQLGYGGTGTTSSSTFTVSRVNIGGIQYNLTNVRQLAFTSYDTSNTGYCAATVILDNGLSFSIGFSSQGQTSLMFTSGTAARQAEANTIEIIDQNVWQPVRSPSNMQGKMQDAMGWGAPNAAASWMMWQNNDGRIMMTGYGNGAATSSTNQQGFFGQFWLSWQGTNVDSMCPPIVN